MKTTELIEKAVPKPVNRAQNLDHIGWHGGYLLVKFKGRDTLYVYGPDIPKEECDKILRVPYPDRLFITNIKNKFQGHKLG